jgi:hypothetical protein
MPSASWRSGNCSYWASKFSDKRKCCCCKRWRRHPTFGTNRYRPTSHWRCQTKRRMSHRSIFRLKSPGKGSIILKHRTYKLVLEWVLHLKTWLHQGEKLDQI